MVRLLPSNVRARQALAVAAAVGATAIAVELILPAWGGVAGMPSAVVFQSAVFGLATSLTAAGLVLVYRAQRIVNFAQLVIGTAGAQLTFQLIRYVSGVPFAVSVALGLALAVIVGVVIDLVFGRRFARAPRLVLTVVTIVAAEVVGSQLASAVLRLPFLPPLKSRPLSDLAGQNSLRNYLPFRGLSFGVGHSGLRFGFAELFAIELSVAALVVLAAWLRLTKSGVAIRAVSENADRAALLGIGVGGLSTLVWAVAGLLSGCTAILIGFLTVPGAAFSFNPFALLAPLVGAAVARFRNIPVAVFSTVILLTIVQCWQFAVVRDVGLTSTFLLVVLAVALTLQRRTLFRAELAAATSWEAADEVRPIPKEFNGVVGLTVARYGFVAAVVAGVAIIPWVASTSITVLAQSIALGGIVALSLVVLTGWAGQVSLGQFGFVAVGLAVGGGLTARAGVPFWLAVPMAAIICAAVALIVGLPALRVQGLLLGVVTFAFGVAVADALFDRRYFGWMLPSGAVSRPTAFVLNFNDERSMYYLCAAAFLLAVFALYNLRRSRFGRLLIAVRENESNVQSFGIPLVRTKLIAFAISGGLCGFAGAIYAHQLRAVTGQAFGPVQSFLYFVAVVIGGVTSLPGALLGVGYFEITGYAFQHNLVLAFIAGFLPLFFIYTAPAGLISIVVGLRDSILRIVAQRRQLVVPSLFADYDPDALARRLIPLAEPITGAGMFGRWSRRRFELPTILYRPRPVADGAAQAVPLPGGEFGVPAVTPAAATPAAGAGLETAEAPALGGIAEQPLQGAR